MTRLIRTAATLLLVFALATPALAEMPPDKAKAELAEYKAFFSGVGDTRFDENFAGIEQIMGVDAALGAKMWESTKPIIDKARKQLSDVDVPDAGAFLFSSSEGGAPATSFELGDGKIFGRLVMKAPVNTFNLAYTIPPGQRDYDHGDVMLRVTMDDAVFFEGRATLWEAEYQKLLELPFAVIPGDVEVPAKTSRPGPRSGGLWQDEDRHGIFAEALLSTLYDAIAPGTHRFTVELFAKEAFGRKPAIATGGFELVVTEAGKKKLAKGSARKAPTAAGGKYGAIDKQVTKILKSNKAFANEGVTVLYARTQTKWNETRHALTNRVTKRHIKADMAYRMADGSCRITQGVKFCQKSTSEGGGKPFTALDQCSLVLADGLGQNTYAIPCAKAK